MAQDRQEMVLGAVGLFGDGLRPLGRVPRRLQLLFPPFAISDVDKRRQEAVFDRDARNLDHAHRTVLAGDVVIDGPDIGFLFRRSSYGGFPSGDRPAAIFLVGTGQLPPLVERWHVVARVAECLDKAVVEVEDRALIVHQAQRYGDLLYQPAEPGFTLA